MPRVWYILLAAMLVAAGCNSTGKKPATATNGPNAPGTTPFWSEDKPTKTNAVGGGPKTEVDGMLAGMLIDNATGRPQPNALINVTPADGGANAKPIGVQADDQGYFTIKGLKTGVTYQLSARSDDHGRTLGGSVTTQAPNTRMLIRLSEGKAAPIQAPPNGSDPKSSADKKDGKTKLDPPPAFIPRPEPAPKDPLLEGTDNSWGPGKTPAPSRPLAAPPPPPANNPNIADSSNWMRPPPASIPATVVPPRREEPAPPPSSPSMSATPSNSSPLAAATLEAPAPRSNFILYDARRDPIEFRNLSDKRLIVLDFWTTYCPPCLQKIPSLIKLQTRYSDYVEVIGVACDNVRFDERVKAVDKIVKGHTSSRINYRILFEGDGKEGRIQSHFNIDRYPTLILLDHKGQQLWRGSDVGALEQSINYYLQRK